ncbi:MAG: hypothetical protein IJI22_02645 [Bacilli bacterium]|nr:hypothetical protein [Bacilli bacterium]
MNYNYNAMQKAKKKLFAYSGQYNHFKNIDQEKIDETKKLLERKFEGAKCESDDVFSYLSNPRIYADIKTYDEKILFLILALDPELEIYDLYLNSEIVSNATIAKASDEEKDKLIQKRKEQIHKFFSEAKNRFPFFDREILSYESDFAKILRKDKVFSGIKYDAISKIIERANQVDSFDSISEDDLEKLKTTSNVWLSCAEDLKDYNSLAYNLLKNPKHFKINTIPEQVLMFLLLADPELDMLRVYEEESQEDKIKERCLEEFGFYDFHLIQLEKKYHDKFLPDKKVSSFGY